MIETNSGLAVTHAKPSKRLHCVSVQLSQHHDSTCLLEVNAAACLSKLSVHPAPPPSLRPSKETGWRRGLSRKAILLFFAPGTCRPVAWPLVLNTRGYSLAISFGTLSAALV